MEKSALKTANHSYIALSVNASFYWHKNSNNEKEHIVVIANNKDNALVELHNAIVEQGYLITKRKTDDPETLTTLINNDKVDVDLNGCITMFVVGTQIDNMQAIFRNVHWVEALSANHSEKTINKIKKIPFFGAIDKRI